MRYYLGKDLVIVEADVTEFVETRVDSPDGKILKERTDTGFTATDITVSLKTTADPEYVYILDPAPRGLKDQSLAVRVGDNGLLTSVDLESKDRSGETLIQIARVVGQLAGAAAGFRGPDGFDLSRIIRALPQQDSGNPSTAERKRRERRLESQSIEALYFLQESETARELWAEIDRLEDDLTNRRSALRGQTDTAAGSLEAARFSLAEKRAEFFEGSIAFLENQAEKAKSAFAAALREFIAAKGFGRETRRRPIRRHLEIGDLPPSAVLAGAAGEDQIVEALEKKFPRALSLYREAGIVVTFDPAIVIPRRQGLSPAKAENARERKNEIRIFYREPIPGFLRVHAWADAVRRDQKRFASAFGPVDEKWVFVVHPDLPVRSIGCDRKAFSSQNLQLAINGQGRVVGISRSAASSLAAAASGTASALAAVRGEIAETLEQLEAIAKAGRGLSLEKLEAQIELLKLQLEKLKKDADGKEKPKPSVS
ncbi:MAG: hypothetical protein ACYDH3_07535 [Candidatus Aminicenantales bacterium]